MKHAASFLICGVFFAFSSFSLATSPQQQSLEPGELPPTKQVSKASAETIPEVTSIMDQLQLNLNGLKDFLFSAEVILDETQKLQILQHMEQLQKLLKDPELHKGLGESFKSPIIALQNQLDEGKRFFDLGNIDYSKQMLRSALEFCISCHTLSNRGAEANKNTAFEFSKFPASKLFYEAEYLFTIRQFEPALKAYDFLMAQHPAHQLTVLELDKIIQRKLTIFLRRLGNPQLAEKSFQQDLKNKKLPVFIQNKLQKIMQGLSGFKALSAQDRANSKKLIGIIEKDYAELIKPQEQVPEDQLPKLVYLSGVLFDFVNKNKLDENSYRMNLWLVRLEKHLEEPLYQVMGDVLLRDCIQGSASVEIKKMCFADYKNMMLERYSMTTGIEIPQNVQAELARLEALSKTKKTTSKKSKKPVSKPK